MTAIVTGASHGIGKVVALRLAAGGTNVVLCARDATALQETAEAMQSPSRVMALDLRLPDSAAIVVNAAIETFGTLDVLVNNAGATKRGDFETLTDAGRL